MNEGPEKRYFERLGPLPSASPVIIAVPHAGRIYPEAMLADAMVPQHALMQLEDRFADLLVEGAVALGATAYVARYARAWLDLNRDPREIDPLTLAGHQPAGLISSPKTRSGLGLVPRRAGLSNSIWRRRFALGEIEARILDYHHPFHQAVSDALAQAQARFGTALLIDCHSMPPISKRDAAAPSIVLGDRFGSSASPIFTDRLEALFSARGIRVARNSPYAGGYGVIRHGQPARGIHAVQIEFDRRLYLDEALDAPGDGLESARHLMASAYEALVEEAGALPGALAAE